MSKKPEKRETDDEQSIIEGADYKSEIPPQGEPNPSIGRIVHYWNMDWHNDKLKTHHDGCDLKGRGSGPYAMLVTDAKTGDTTVSGTVFAPGGGLFFVTDVPYHAGTGKKMPTGASWEWAPRV